jgi:NADH:ubiquinone oxidoreductase subunit E
MSSSPSLDYPVNNPESVIVNVSRHVEHWRDMEGNLIMILHDIQDEHGYVPRDCAMELARELGVSLARIYEVITFYHYFKLTPPGKHNVAVCTGTACYLKGAPNILSELENQLGIKEGETTEDRRFHLETVRCIGCCGLSPAIVADGKTHGRVRSSEVGSIINEINDETEAAK